ncbi:NDP-sugar synthase [Candidatus Nitronereus thalassa]|uniref:NDP-sugar synthase n=1 Tax=Candidatus Nitronereus thalassa TaxID=3020898 RepID=A0ABU3K3J3_9BACT|nr:NDP-sugar synthase [Candidatus Nitronereus thalassa]MDT7040980.1 NDP-sugar synthase [Candidatus Nitronereus thalassa]
MKAMVLAAGLGTRLRPLTNSLPKPLLSLGPHPLLVWNLLLLRKHGIADVIMNLHYLGEQIQHAIGDGSQWGLKVTYSFEPVLLGTGGGVKQAEPFFEGEPFLVINGDTIFDLNLSAVIAHHREAEAIATMVLRDDPDVDQWGVIETDAQGQVLRINGNGRPASQDGEYVVRRMFAGIHVVDPFLLRHVPEGVPYSIIDAYVLWLERGASVSSYLLTGYWSDVGTPQRYAQVQQDFDFGRIRLPA